MEELIHQIENCHTHLERLQQLQRLQQALGSNPPAATLRRLVPLLYHRDWYIRREVAFLIDFYGVALKHGERLQFAFALQQFDQLRLLMEAEPEARRILFEGCLDSAPRLRAAVAATLSPTDCRTPRETACWHYACGDYLTLVELGGQVDYRQAVETVLRQGMNDPENPVYHRRQCAFCLNQLKLLEDASAVVRELLLQIEREPEESMPPPEEPPGLDPLAQLLWQLNRRGIILDGRRVYPDIAIRSATGRITYRNPALQTLPPEERMRRLQPQPGNCFLRFDFICMEPTLLLHFLVEKFYLSLENIPRGDIYLAINPQNRQQGKKWLNILINGGPSPPVDSPTTFLMQLREAISELRQEMLHQTAAVGGIEILGGSVLPLPETTINRGGKILNRLIQGSAARVFHQALVELQQWLREERVSAHIAFLLFDELWLECPADQAPQLLKPVLQKLQSVNQYFSLLVPLHIRYMAEKKEDTE
ncbi:MAG: hypothetical protein Kow0042_31030 [Calditrichia bacterium]